MSKKRDPEVGILQYLETQNRPYSAGDIFNNLHKEFGKTAVVKALESLAEQNKIIEKTYGKQKVYSPSQEKFADYNETELKELDGKATLLTEQFAKFQQESSQQDAIMKGFTSQISTDDALTAIEQLTKQNSGMRERIQKLKSGSKLISKEERCALYKRKNVMVTHWKKRKRLSTDMINCILEGYPKSKKTLLEETGVETDEEIGVKIPS